MFSIYTWNQTHIYIPNYKISTSIIVHHLFNPLNHNFWPSSQYQEIVIQSNEIRKNNYIFIICVCISINVFLFPFLSSAVWTHLSHQTWLWAPPKYSVLLCISCWVIKQAKISLSYWFAVKSIKRIRCKKCCVFDIFPSFFICIPPWNFLLKIFIQDRQRVFTAQSVNLQECNEN